MKYSFKYIFPWRQCTVHIFKMLLFIMLAVSMKKLFLTVSFTFLFIADKKIDIRLN